MTTFELIRISTYFLSFGVMACYVAAVVQIFMHGESGMGATCIGLLFCCGIGVLATFIYSWTKAGEWKNGPLMVTWTLCFMLSTALRITLLVALRTH